MSTDWAPTIAEVIDDAAIRARIDPGTLTVFQQRTSRRLLNMVLTAWLSDESALHLTTTLYELAIPSVGVTSIDMPADCWAVLEVNYRKDGVDVPVTPMTRDEYMAVPNKTTKGRPSRFWAERTQAGVKLHPWLTPENTTDKFIVNYLRLPADVKADMTQKPDIARMWYDALADELAKRMYQAIGTTTKQDRNGKEYSTFDPAFHNLLKTNAADSYRTAKYADRERVDTHYGVRF